MSSSPSSSSSSTSALSSASSPEQQPNNNNHTDPASTIEPRNERPWGHGFSPKFVLSAGARARWQGLLVHSQGCESRPGVRVVRPASYRGPGFRLSMRLEAGVQADDRDFRHVHLQRGGFFLIPH